MEKLLSRVKEIYQRFLEDLTSLSIFAEDLLSSRGVVASLDDDIDFLVRGSQIAKENFISDYASALKGENDVVIDLVSKQDAIKGLEKKLRDALSELTGLARRLEQQYRHMPILTQTRFSDFLSNDNLNFDKILTECRKQIKQKRVKNKVRSMLRRKIQEARVSLKGW